MAETAVTIMDVAREAGVSPSCVSLVINERPNVSRATAAKVRAIMGKLGYVLAPVGQRRGVRRRVTSAPDTGLGQVAFFDFSGADMGSLAPVYADVLHGIEGALAEEKAHLLYRTVRAGTRISWDELPSGVTGAIFLGDMSMASASGLASVPHHVPLVRVMGTPETDDTIHADHITYNNTYVGPLAGRYLLLRGHRSVMVFTQNDRGLFHERIEGLRATLGNGGTVLTRVCPGPNEFADAVSELASLPSRPGALFSTGDGILPLLYPLLLTAGIRPGKDIEIVSCNNEEPLLRELHPRPAEIELHTRLIGRRAVEQLRWRRQNPLAPRTCIMLAPELVPAGK